ncbi:MAG TPA: glycosyltransferase family 87 protein [Stellaceae bacterium]|nr:glycosyltransferase family 87 protein [Stellaceae bacterium]
MPIGGRREADPARAALASRWRHHRAGAECDGSAPLSVVTREIGPPSLGAAAPGTVRPLLGRRRAVSLSALLLVLELAGFLFFVAGTHGLIVPLAKPTSTDFVSFYAAGRLADAGTPALAYNKSAHYAAEERATQPGISYNFFYYPPVFLLVCAALARLPYLAAFVTFEAATLTLYIPVMLRILGRRGWAALVPLLAFPPVLWTVGFGQNGFLTAGLFGAATLLIDRRPLLAGSLFGALCCKPHLALLVPVALVSGRRWRAFIAAGASAIGCCLLSLAVFGPTTWRAFLTAIAASPAVYVSGKISFDGFVTPFGAARLLGAAPSVAYAVQAGATLAAAGFVAWVWSRNRPLPLRAASLAAATLIAVPLALFYDLLLAGVAAAWLLRSDGKCRLPEWGGMVLAALYVLSLNPRGIAAASHLPIGPLIPAALVALVAAMAVRDRTTSTTGASASSVPRRLAEIRG